MQKMGLRRSRPLKKCNPAVVLLDIMMPGLDGYKVCQKIREISQVPIILITAKGEDYERVMGLDIGADDYIVKPFSPNEVMARVCRAPPYGTRRGRKREKSSYRGRSYDQYRSLHCFCRNRENPDDEKRSGDDVDPCEKSEQSIYQGQSA